MYSLTMAATRISCLNFGSSSLKPQNPFAGRHTLACLNPNYDSPRFPLKSLKSVGYAGQFGCLNGISSSGPRIGALYGGIGHVMCVRSYSSSPDGATPASGDGWAPWMDKVKDVWNSVVYTGEKAKEASGEVTPHVQKLLDMYPYLNDVVVPVGNTLLAILMAWFVLPKFLRKLHAYSEQGAANLYGSSFWEPVPYERSALGALEAPLQYLITFMAFVQIAIMVAPTAIAPQYIGTVCKGASIVSFVWFLNQWKTITITLALGNSVGAKRNNLMIADKISSVSLLILAAMGLAETCGVPLKFILTIGGLGGAIAAFASKDILENILSGLSVQISQPFGVGDAIKAGSVEGQVLNVGLTATSLLTAEKFPAMVPNSLFSSQVIVNKSRAQWRSMATTIPLQNKDFDKIPMISEDIEKMLKENADVFLDKEAPYCYLSRIKRSFTELTIGCNLKFGNKRQFFKAQQKIILKSLHIIELHGASVCGL